MNSASASHAGQRHAPQGRKWLLWAALGLVIAGAAIAIALAVGAGRDDSIAAGTEPDARSDDGSTGIPANPADIRQAFDQHTARAKDLVDQESWDPAVAELDRALALAGDGGIDADRTSWGQRLRDIATRERENQATFEQFARARDAGDVAEAVRLYRAIPEDSVYREKARISYEQVRDGWLNKARDKARELSRRSKCEDIDLLVQRAQELFEGDSELQNLADDCAKRQARKRHQELLDDARNAYKGGEYERAHRTCQDALKLSPRDQDTLLLCGLAACKLKKRPAAISYYAKLDEQKQRVLRQSCMKQGIDPAP